MEILMLKIKSRRIPVLLIAVGLLIMPIFLAACDSDTDSAEVPFGLRAAATDDLLGSSTDEVSTLSQPTIDEGTGSSVDAVAEVQSAGVTAGTNGNGNQARVADRSEQVFDPATAAELNAGEVESLTYMREEEKLARDVYLALYDQWGLPVFQNIAGSEQAHMDSVLTLLEQYGLTDPAAGKDAVEFSDPLFQSLYEQLLAQGSVSVTDALKVGATIEELDIVDLQARLAQTDNEYITRVYNNLLAGSENHLRAFVSNLERQTGEIYQPVHLDQDAYQAIMNGASAPGSGSGGNGSRGGNGGNGGYGGGNGANGNGRGNGQGRNA
jgi:hypothetical protein